MTLETVALHLAAGQLNTFFPLLQQGVVVPATVGCSLKSLLCDQFAIPAEYVASRITTVFVDNRPVDDLDRTLVQDGSRVTATMRRGGFYAALRQGISHAADHIEGVGERGCIRVKLFNLLLGELGPLILAHGQILDQDELTALLRHFPGQYKKTSADTGRVLLTVSFME